MTLKRGNHQEAFIVNCCECGKELRRNFYFGDGYNYKCDKCKVIVYKKWDKKRKQKEELIKPKTIWDEKLEFYKLNKSIYGRGTNQ